MLMRGVFLAGLGLSLSGCASGVDVYDANQSTVAGIPFRATEVYVKLGERNRHSEHGEDCTPTPFVQTVSLPTGGQYFISVDAAQLAKTGFEVEFNDAGALRSVSLNSEPGGADTIEALTGALTSLLPFAGVTADAGAAPAPQAAGARPACDAGEVRVRFVRLSEYLDAQERGAND